MYDLNDLECEGGPIEIRRGIVFEYILELKKSFRLVVVKNVLLLIEILKYILHSHVFE